QRQTASPGIGVRSLAWIGPGSVRRWFHVSYIPSYRLLDTHGVHYSAGGSARRAHIGVCAHAPSRTITGKLIRDKRVSAVVAEPSTGHHLSRAATRAPTPAHSIAG